MSALRKEAILGNSFNLAMEVGHEDMWLGLRSIAALRSGFTAAELSHVTGASADRAEFYLSRLTRHGIARREGMTTDRRQLYSIEKLARQPIVLDDRGQPSRDYAFRTAIWTAIRIMGTFTVRDLYLNVRDSHPVALAQVRAYVNRLQLASYVMMLEGPGRMGDDEFTLRPAMNTGPLPPRLCEAALVYDPNRRAFYGAGEAREVKL